MSPRSADDAHIHDDTNDCTLADLTKWTYSSSNGELVRTFEQQEEGSMKSHFLQVLANENECLTRVTDRAQLAEWRDRIVKAVMTPRSPYALALRNTRDVQERAEFLSRWRELIADAIGRILSHDDEGRSRSTKPTVEPVHQAGNAPAEPEKIAVLILAALHGGCTLSHVAQDQWPLDAALDIALAPFANSDEPSGGTSNVQPGQ